MWTTGKYVVGMIRGNLAATVISEEFDHADLRPLFDEGTIRSGGFFNVSAGLDPKDPYHVSLSFYGESRGLRVQSWLEDRELLEKALGLYTSPFFS